MARTSVARSGPHRAPMVGRCAPVGLDREGGTHALEHRDVAETRRTVVHLHHGHVAVGDDAPRHDEEGRRRGVSGHGPLDWLQTGGPDAHDATLAPRLDGDVGPASASISSVWVRVVTGSRTTVVPLAESPARRMADFTWALADLGGPVDAAEPAAPHSQGGQAALPATAAPAPPSASAARPRDPWGGRRATRRPPARSPSRSPRPRPARSRMEVPELPQSSGPAAACSRPRPPCSATLPSGWRSTETPDGLDGRHRRGDVGAVRQPVDDRCPLGQRAEEHGAVRDRLLPGRAHACPGTAHRRARRGSAGRSRQMLGPAPVAVRLDGRGQPLGVGRRR